MSDEAVIVDDPLLFRRILGAFPTGVTVVATIDDGRPVGLAVGPFFSVSLEPPLVGLCVMTTPPTATTPTPWSSAGAPSAATRPSDHPSISEAGSPVTRAVRPDPFRRSKPAGYRRTDAG